MKAKFGFHPRAWLDSILTYPRYLGVIKPELWRGASDEIEPRLNACFRAVWAKALRPPLGRRLLVMAPHPDDEAIGCGALLLLHKGKAEIQIVNVYNGDGGGALDEAPWRDEPEYKNRLIETRKQELDSVAAKLGAANVMRLNVSDCTGTPGKAEEQALRELLHKFQPDVVLIPWFLDGHSQHRATNLLFAKAAAGYDCCVLGFEIWSLMPPNAFIDITDVLDEKLDLVRQYTSQLRTVDYVSYVSGLARVRAFHHTVGDRRGGAAESYLALPSKEYCELSLRFLEKK